MRYLVLGAGALGGYYGAKLLQGGADVEFLVRPRRAAQLAANGLVIKGGPEGDITVRVTTLQAGQIAHPYDVVLLCCKAYDLQDAITAISPAVGPDSCILPFLNGIKHIDILAERFGERRVLGGLNFGGGVLTANGEILRALHNAGTTKFGELNGTDSIRCHQILRAFTDGGMTAKDAGMTVGISNTIVAELWAKITAFACSSAIATLCRSRAGGIAAAPAGTAFVSAVIDEVAPIVAAEGYPAPPETWDLIRGMYSKPGSQYGPSMLADMEKGYRTEAEHVIGDMVDRAQRHGIRAPVLTAARCNLQIYEATRPNT